QAIVSDPSAIKPAVFLLAYAGMTLRGLLHILCAVFADKIYRDYAITTIGDIKKNSDDIDFDYRKRGGTNFFLLLLGFFAVQYIPSIVFSLFI
ncbi:MAG: hypothetical protein J6T73_07460, partial [Clostridia bacterium]|nr:hypothetical protein [Clostridia bacterium]